MVTDNMGVIEFWVMRVLMHPGTWNPESDVGRAIAANVERGALAVLPDGCIAEPVEVFAEELDAHEHAAKLKHDSRDITGTATEDYRVILNADVPV